MDPFEVFDECTREFYSILQKYRMLREDDKLFNNMEKDFWDAQLSIMAKLDPKRAREMAKRLNKDMEKHDSKLSKFL
jgi:hypothetical protein